jgi:hypothetical protein
MNWTKNLLLAGALALLGGCVTAPEAGTAFTGEPAAVLPAATTEGCGAAREVAWPAAGEGLRLVGHARGATCARATVTAFLVDSQDRVLFQVDMRAKDLRLIFGEAADPVPVTSSQMGEALVQWLTQRNETSGRLPAWRTDDAAFAAEEFPFLINQELGQATYEALRAADRPLLRLLQGSESEAIYVLTSDSTLVEVGLQMFPG